MPALNGKMDGCFIMPVLETYTDSGTICMGKVESGMTRNSSTLYFMPNKIKVTVEQLWSDDIEVNSIGPGEDVKVKLKDIEEEDVWPGFVLCDNVDLITTGRVFDAEVYVTASNIITAGFVSNMHIHCAIEELTVKALICLVDKTTREKSKTRPRYVKQNQMAFMRLETENVICLETFKEFPQLGKFTMRDDCGTTIAIGKVLRVVE